jgi:glycyl-tRNA synthetase
VQTPLRTDQIWDQLRESQWFLSLEGVGADTASLLQWVNKKGKKLAPGLALVRNPQVTLSWLAGRAESRADEPIDFKDFIRHLATEQFAQTGLVTPCPNCGGDLTEPRNFNLMFPTKIGAVDDESSTAYLRPETAQGIFVNFKNVVDTGRVKVPFGIAQVGKSFRNEINPRNYIFRSREFEQMEIEFFCHPDEAARVVRPWREIRFQWYVGLGPEVGKAPPARPRPDELAFYSTATADIEYSFPFGVSELEGIAHRGDYDLGQHQKFSGKDLSYFDEDRWERDKAALGLTSFKDYLKRREGEAKPGYPYQYLPHVIEPSAGADRATLAFLCEAYTEDQVGGEPRTVLKFHPRLAPIKAAVFPLVRKDGMPEKAEAIYRALKRHFNVFTDDRGRHRPALSPPGRGRHALRHHRRRPDAGRRHGHLPRPRQLPPVAHPVGRRRRRPTRPDRGWGGDPDGVGRGSVGTDRRAGSHHPPLIPGPWGRGSASSRATGGGPGGRHPGEGSRR